MPDITVPVPEGRTADFFKFFSLWLDEDLDLSGDASTTLGGTSEPVNRVPWHNTDDDLDDAVTLWNKFSPNARAVFSFLIDNPGIEYSGTQIAKEAGIPNGAHGVAGVLAWPGRHGRKIGRGLPTQFREDPDTYESFYRMDAERAELFKAAREAVEVTG